MHHRFLIVVHFTQLVATTNRMVTSTAGSTLLPFPTHWISLKVCSISLRLNGFGFLETWPVKMYRSVFPIMSDPAQVSVWQRCTGEPRDYAPSILLYLIKHPSQHSPLNYKQIYNTGISVIFHIERGLKKCYLSAGF